MADENLADMINAANAPFAKMIGVRMTLATKERVEGELTVTPEHCTLPTNLHGGAIMAFADNMGGCGAFLNLPDGATTATVESKTNFLRPVPVGEIAKAVSTPINIGRTLQVWKTEIFREDGKLAAVVTQTQIVKPASA
jgi:uncharacterized protein (TIGR00369 family)